MSIARRLVPHGDGQAIVVPPELLKELGATRESWWELGVVDGRLVAAPMAEPPAARPVADEAEEQEFRRLMDETHRRYEKTFRRLAE